MCLRLRIVEDKWELHEKQKSKISECCKITRKIHGKVKSNIIDNKIGGLLVYETGGSEQPGGIGGLPRGLKKKKTEIYEFGTHEKPKSDWYLWGDGTYRFRFRKLGTDYNNRRFSRTLGVFPGYIFKKMKEKNAFYAFSVLFIRLCHRFWGPWKNGDPGLIPLLPPCRA